MIPNQPESSVPGVEGISIPPVQSWQIERLARILCVADGWHPDDPIEHRDLEWMPRHLENRETVNDMIPGPVRWHNYARDAYRAIVTDAVMFKCKPSLAE